MTPGGLGCGVSVDSGGESLRVGGEISSLANHNTQYALPPVAAGRWSLLLRSPLLLVVVDGARGVSWMGSGQQVFDPGQPLVELGQRHLAPGRLVLRGGPGPAGTLGDETGRHLRG